MEACENVQQHLRNTAINNSGFQRRITRTISIDNKHLTIVGQLDEPGFLEKLLAKVIG